MWHVQLLPAALGCLFLCAVPSRAALPMKNKKSLRTLERLRNCRVTPRLYRVPRVSCAGKGRDTQRAPAQIGSSGGLHASLSIKHFHSSFWCGSWADLPAVSSPDNVVPCECSAFRFRVTTGLWLAHAAPCKRMVHANSSASACWLPFPGLARALQACLHSPEGFRALSSIPIYITAIYLFCGVYSRTRLGAPGDGMRVVLTVREETHECWEVLFLTNSSTFCLL